MGILNLSDPPPPVQPVKRSVDFDTPTPTLTLDQKIERDLKESPPRGWSRTYLILLLALVPLVFSLLQPGKKHGIQERFEHTLSKLPVKEQARLVVELSKSKQSFEKLIMALPDHRIENALLGRDSWMHWLYAAAAAGGFYGFFLLLFPSSRSEPQQLLKIGLFTGTIGMILLLLFQVAAAVTQGSWPVPVGAVSLVFCVFFYLVKFIGYSYTVALSPKSGLPLSLMGFTFGVGFCEETCKLSPVVRHFRFKATLDWRGACMWGMASGVGFGISEGISYASGYNGIQTAGIYAVRFISCVALHAIWSGAAAITLFERQDSIQEGGIGTLEMRWRLLQIIAVPMALHGLYDTFLKKELSGLALFVALLSFGWMALQVEKMCRRENRTRAAMTVAAQPV